MRATSPCMTEVVMTHPSLWDAVRQEEESYAFVAEASSQPQWDVPETIAINVAVAGRAGSGTKEAGYPVDVEEYVDSASEVIEVGACGVHIDFTWVTDSKGRRLDKDLSPVEAYGLVLDPLRSRFGNWHSTNRDAVTKSNLELFTRARTIAAELGRRPATADQYCIQIGLPARG
jgi:3-keto-5-aminohexanoate cleavage enzyme